MRRNVSGFSIFKIEVDLLCSRLQAPCLCLGIYLEDLILIAIVRDQDTYLSTYWHLTQLLNE